MNPARTDPRIIRDALAIADRSTIYRAGVETGVHNRTIHRWMLRRAALGRPWPTDADIAAWDADQAARAAARARKREQSRAYRIRVYVNRGPVKVSSLGTARRLQALQALGHLAKDLAPRLGISTQRVSHLTTRRFDMVYPETAAAVDALFRDLCMVVPVDADPTHPRQVRVHDRARRDARRRGYAPPLAWDDIDDPTERPKLGNRRDDHRSHSDVDQARVDRVLAGHKVPDCTKAEKEIITRAWIASGRSTVALERLTGWKPERYAKVSDMAAAS